MPQPDEPTPDPAPDLAPAPAPLSKLQLRCLADWLPILETPGLSAGQWQGGDTQADGTITMPWFDYAEPVGSWPGPCAEPIVVPFDWMAWQTTRRGRELANDPAAIATATAAELRALAIAIRRGDRFSEGTIAGAFERGFLAAISRRAASLVRGDARAGGLSD